MCRNITELRGLVPAATAEEIAAAARQYVRKVSGITHPSPAGAEAFGGGGRRGRGGDDAPAGGPASASPTPKSIPPLRRPEIAARMAR